MEYQIALPKLSWHGVQLLCGHCFLLKCGTLSAQAFGSKQAQSAVWHCAT